MRKSFLCATAIFCLALSSSGITVAGEANMPPLGPVSAQDFGAPSPFDLSPPVFRAPAPQPAPVYTAQNTAPEGTASFLDPNVAAISMANPLPPAPSAVSTGAVPVNEARPLPPPSAPYPVPSQAIVPVVAASPAPALPPVYQGAPAPMVMQETGTGDFLLQTSYPVVAVDGQGNTVSFVVPVQIPVSAEAGQAQLAAAQQYYLAAQPVPGQQPQFAPIPYQAPQAAAMTPGTGEYLDLSFAPAGSVVAVTPAQVKQAVLRGVQLIVLDVRAELVRDVEGHVIGDVHVEFTPRQTFVNRVTAKIPDRSFPVVLYCHDGIWSAQAAADLLQAGYRVFHMGAFRLWL